MSDQPKKSSGKIATTGYIMNFLPKAATISMGEWSYGPIPSDGEVVCNTRYEPMPAEYTEYASLKNITRTTLPKPKVLKVDVSVQVDDRTVELPAPRAGVFLLVERRTAMFIATTGRDTYDIIFPLRIEKQGDKIKCQGLAML